MCVKKCRIPHTHLLPSDAAHNIGGVDWILTGPVIQSSCLYSDFCSNVYSCSCFYFYSFSFYITVSIPMSFCPILILVLVDLFSYSYSYYPFIGFPILNHSYKSDFIAILISTYSCFSYAFPFLFLFLFPSFYFPLFYRIVFCSSFSFSFSYFLFPFWFWFMFPFLLFFSF